MGTLFLLNNKKASLLGLAIVYLVYYSVAVTFALLLNHPSMNGFAQYQVSLFKQKTKPFVTWWRLYDLVCSSTIRSTILLFE